LSVCGFGTEAEDQEGVMDNLLEALKNGSAFNVSRERKDGRKRTPRAAGGQFVLCTSEFRLKSFNFVLKSSNKILLMCVVRC